MSAVFSMTKQGQQSIQQTCTQIGTLQFCYRLKLVQGEEKVVHPLFLNQPKEKNNIYLKCWADFTTPAPLLSFYPNSVHWFDTLWHWAQVFCLCQCSKHVHMQQDSKFNLIGHSEVPVDQRKSHQWHLVFLSIWEWIFVPFVTSTEGWYMLSIDQIGLGKPLDCITEYWILSINCLVLLVPDVHVHVHTYTCTHVHMYTCTHVHMYTCKHLSHMYTCTHVHCKHLSYTCTHVHCKHLSHMYTCTL